MAAAPTFRVGALELFEPRVVLRLPFRFGVVTLTACPQAFVRATLVFADGRTAAGVAAEMMAPKWFDKNPALSNAQNLDQLRRALELTRDAARAYEFREQASLEDSSCAKAGRGRVLTPPTLS